ncbi:MAG: DUF3299 domain-containing protein [Planctomycetota bacterium]
MRPILILFLLGALTLILGAGVLAQPNSAPERALPDGPIVSSRIDSAPKAAIQIDVDVDIDMGDVNTRVGFGRGDADSGFASDPLAGAPLDLAVLPGQAGSHSQNAYVAGSASSDLPLEEGVELYAFDDLLLPDYVPPSVLDEDEEHDPEGAFPAEVLELDGHRVALEGYMQPLSFDGNNVTSFVLSPYPPGCCFGGMPGLDEWVDVTVTGASIKYIAYRVVRVTGELEVGEQLDDWGYVSSLYRMDTDKVEELW